MNREDLERLVAELQQRNAFLEERERELADRNEELLAQKEELTAAIEAFIQKSDSLSRMVQELEERNFELDQILYRSSHDLRSPISSMEGLLQLMKPENLPTQYINLHTFLCQKVGQMNEVLDGLGTLAHASFDHIKLENVQVRSFIERCIRDVNYVPGYSNISFEVDVDESTFIQADPFLFGILVKCLLSNAITFRDQSRKGNISVIARKRKGNFFLTVADDGEGILPEVRSRIFEMFFRGSSRSIGPGLGLYVVNRLVQRFNGEVKVESSPGKTIFKVVIPVRE